MSRPDSWQAAWAALAALSIIDTLTAPRRRARVSPWSAALLCAALAGLASLHTSYPMAAGSPAYVAGVAVAALAIAAVAGPLPGRALRLAVGLALVALAALAYLLPATGSLAPALGTPLTVLSRAAAAVAAALLLYTALLARDPGVALRPVRISLDAALLFQAAAFALQSLSAGRAWAAPWYLDPLACWRLLGAALVAALVVGSAAFSWPRRTLAYATAGVTLLLWLILLGALPLLQALAVPSHYWVGPIW